jgi:predicted esterase
LLEGAGANVLYRETPMFHQIDPEFVREVSDWIRTVARV